LELPHAHAIKFNVLPSEFGQATRFWVKEHWFYFWLQYWLLLHIDVPHIQKLELTELPFVIKHKLRFCIIEHVPLFIFRLHYWFTPQLNPPHIQALEFVKLPSVITHRLRLVVLVQVFLDKLQ